MTAASISISSWSLRREVERMESRTEPSERTVERLRKQYPVGSPVRLVETNDPHPGLDAGACGRVDFIDDAGTIFVDWDCGLSLGVIYGAGSIERLGEKNYLRNAELDIEGEEAGYGMIDGIINNVPKSETRERERPSVIGRLAREAPQKAMSAVVPAGLEREF
jgi:hypothetical protein